ncbi:hypothetical protein AWB69_07789 [Caballeronia udeis]|uniref:Lipoprotein n=1 Tax=Caballeronia udeis TaxID=1232866 RepID=A0A158JGV0_9BURK|nr:hypothetical protein [Caballeronia udeis]SAL67570.1 hypothetical protein AWB69_07789 [Caballeronia udeis]
MKLMFAAALTALALGACSKPTAPASALAAPVIAIAAVAPPPTMADWTSALSTVYKESDRKDEHDGVTNFFCVFGLPGSEKGATHLVAFGKRDAFRKLRFYTPGIQLEATTSLETYLSLKDGGTPILFLKPYYFGPDGWLFMQHVAVMADGDVIFERDFKDARVDHDQLPGGVTERYNFIATPADIEGLRKIHPDTKLVIRLSGKKGYVTVDKMMTSQFRANIQDSLKIYDAMTASLSSHIPPS